MQINRNNGIMETSPDKDLTHKDKDLKYVLKDKD